MTVQISVLSKEYVRVPVEARESGSVVNPTGDLVQMAFIPDSARQPASGDWKSAVWETDGTIYYARILVGPGTSAVLPVGAYRVWVKITDSPEVPARPAGSLVIF